MNKYRGKLTNEDVHHIVNRLGLKDKYKTSAYQYFVEGKYMSRLDLRARICPEFIKSCEDEHEHRTTKGVLKKWLYGIEV